MTFSQVPVIVQPAAPTVNFKKLLFSAQTDCVLVGDSDGAVSVYQLKNLHSESSQVRQRRSPPWNQSFKQIFIFH